MMYNNILLIDDDRDDQEIFLEALDNLGVSVFCQTFDSALEALQKLEDNRVSADLIFLDLNMPIMTGREFLAELKSKEPLKDIPVIILSTSSDQKTIEQTISLGAEKFITKPDSFDELIKILSTILN